MTRGEIWKDFLKHTVLTLVIALFLFLIFKSVFTKNGETEYFYLGDLNEEIYTEWGSI